MQQNRKGRKTAPQAVPGAVVSWLDQPVTARWFDGLQPDGQV